MVFGFSSARKGYGSNGVPGFNNSKKRGTIARGNFDGDRKPNRGDCDPFNFKKQDGGEYNWGELESEHEPVEDNSDEQFMAEEIWNRANVKNYPPNAIFREANKMKREEAKRRSR